QGAALSGSAALAGAALGGSTLMAQTPSKPGSSPASAPRHRDLIDVHHHYVTAEYIAQVNPKSPLSPPIKAWNLEKTLADMEKTGTATAILSISNPGLWFGEPTTTRKLARTCNEYAARIVADNPKRFGAFVAMPLPDVEAALQEIQYGLDVLKFDGIGLITNYAGKYLGDPLFAPVFEELNRRKAVVYTHPIACPSCEGLVPEIAPRVIEFGTDTTRTIASMVFSGAASKYPDIRFIWSHCGGTMPFLVDRFEEAAKEPKIAPLLPKGLMYELKRFYYDTAQSANPVTMTTLAKVIPLEQVVFGTDFPFRAGAAQVDSLHRCGFSAQQVRGIERENVLRLIPRLKA
ncbi:MAG: amidohydrolase family protein, partial [Candidatus Korobacteraceae bacterium]